MIFLLVMIVLLTIVLFLQTKNKDILLINAIERDSQNSVFPFIGNCTYYNQLAHISISNSTLERLAVYLTGLLSQTIKNFILKFGNIQYVLRMLFLEKCNFI